MDKFTAHILTTSNERLSLECTPENTRIYLHGEQFEEYDHFWRRMEQERNAGAYRTRMVMGEEVFNGLLEQCVESGIWSYEYTPEPTEGDKENIDEQMIDALSNELEDVDWEDFQ